MQLLRTQNIGLSLIKEMELRGSKIPGVVSLAQGIPSFETNEHIKKAVIESLSLHNIGKYSLSPGLLELREMIEETLRKDGISYDHNNEIIVTAGSIEGLTATLLTILEKSDEVIIPNPSYAAYAEAVRVAHGAPIFVDLHKNDNWSLSMDALEKVKSAKTKAVIICQPNNPTGHIYPENTIRELAEWAKNNNCFLIFDEVYKDFNYTAKTIFRLAKDSKYRGNIVYLHSFSKAFSMTGWRVGYILACKELAREILKIHDSLVTCAPVISQYAAMAALRYQKELIDDIMIQYRKRREIALEHFNKLSDFFESTAPDSGYFFFPKILFKNSGSKKTAIEILEKAKINIVPGIAFGPAGEGYLRFCFGRSEEDLNEAFTRLKNYFHDSLCPVVKL